MALLEKHFSSHHKFRKLFNRNTVKLSYSCMENVANVIRRHNASILNSDDKAEPRPCNRKKSKNAPLRANVERTALCIRQWYHLAVLIKSTMASARETSNLDTITTLSLSEMWITNQVQNSPSISGASMEGLIQSDGP